ncbi:MAG: tetrahydromethanopterin S-methyltransferase subunit H [Archaeoglobaceae archaeon]|nr:tetrahydromethanopterin S-methyltransferase subunit H [Archaeoglobales archaeon]
MLRFAQPKIFEICGIKVGGNPGESKTLLIGSIFYKGHKIVEDEKKGHFNRELAEKLIKEQEELSEKTEIPGIVDVVGMSEEALRKYIDFVASITEKPFLIDSAMPDIKISALKFVKEAGLEKRVIYNSISPEVKDRELIALKESGVDSAIVLTYTMNVLSSKARVEAFQKLLPKLEIAGINKPLVDTFVMDVPSLPAAIKAGVEIKKNFGFPCGSGAHNAIASWKGLRNLLGKESEKFAVVVANTLQIAFGLDFALYGPIEDSKLVFPAVYMLNIAYRNFARTKDFIPI